MSPAEAGIVRAGDRPAGIIEQPSSVRIFQDHRPVIAAELTVVAADGSHLDVVLQSGTRERDEEGCEESGQAAGNIGVDIMLDPCNASRCSGIREMRRYASNVHRLPVEQP